MWYEVAAQVFDLGEVERVGALVQRHGDDAGQEEEVEVFRRGGGGRGAAEGVEVV